MKLALCIHQVTSSVLDNEILFTAINVSLGLFLFPLCVLVCEFE